MTINRYDNEHMFTLLNKYMFTTDNMIELNHNSSGFAQQQSSSSNNILKKLYVKKSQSSHNVDATADENSAENIHATTMTNTTIKPDTGIDEVLYTPKQNDKLFWCFYILLYGKVEYDYTTHVFETEKKFKIQSAEKLREMKMILRQYKLKYSDIEAELVSLQKITIKGIHALCILYKISVIYVKGNIYYILGATNENSCYKNCVIVEYSHTQSKTNKKTQKQTNNNSGFTQSNTQIGIQLDATDAYIENIRNTKIRVKNYNKPMLSIASYTLPVLHEMAEILKITIYNEVGKKKLKKQLYQEVSEKII